MTVGGCVGVGDGTLDSLGVRVLPFMASDIRWPDWMSGSGTLPVSSECETVVMRARKGRRNVGGSVLRASRRVRRMVGANIVIDVAHNAAPDALLFPGSMKVAGDDSKINGHD